MSQAPTLWTKHRAIARSLASLYYLPGGEQQDLEQEALIALWIASRDFDPSAGVEFKTWARFVIRRRLDTVIRLALAGKHSPLDKSQREVRNEDGDWVAIADELPGGVDTADIVVHREILDRIVAAVTTLSPLEREGLTLAVNGQPYTRKSAIGSKRMENAVDRARRKLREAA